MRCITIHLLMCGLLCLSAPLAAQVSQEWINKAKEAGMTDEQIRKELDKLKEQSAQEQPVRNAAGAEVTDRVVAAPEGEGLLSPDAQREANLPAGDLSETVFGREIFTNRNLSFEPDLNVPTPKGYVLSAGDELRINVWGDSELNLKLEVSPEGTVLIPNLGPVAVSGLTIEAAEERLRRELGRIMSTLSGNTDGGNTSVSVSLGRIRSIKVNIVGEVVAPGTYTLPSFATLFNALYAAGGVNSIGSLRKIKVYRNSREVAGLDVYDYLLNGKYDTNIRLEANDMIIVSPYDRLAVIRGKVKRNRIFELKKGETLAQLLEMAGGFTGDAYSKDIRVNRKAGSRYRIETVTEDRYSTFEMMDGDSLTVDPIISFYENRLTVTGAVWRPGEYELNGKVHTVRQLVEQAEGLKGDEFAGRAQITRLNPDFTSTVIAVDIRGILDGTAADVELEREDVLHIPSLFDMREPYTIRVNGAVNSGDVRLPYRENMTVEDAIMMAGGLREAAATVNVEVARRIKDAKMRDHTARTAKTFEFELNDNLGLIPVGGLRPDSLFTLEPFDEVHVRFSPGYREQETVKIRGEVVFTGDYVLEKKNTRLSDVIGKAGGTTPDAYIKGASLRRQLSDDELRRVEAILRMSSDGLNNDSIALSMADIRDYSVGINLEKALAEPGSDDDVVLRDGDEIYVPQQQSTVKISGAVIYPNSVTWTEEMDVKECLSHAGGYSDIARKYPIVIYMNGKVATTQRHFFVKHYPKVEPGCEIVIPAKKEHDRTANLAEILSITNTTTSMAAVVAALINALK